jgi:quercetin dioxygenase-like cupin family protein
MTHEEYVARVLAGVYPADRLVPAADSFANGNGVVDNLLLGACGGVSLIRSPRGVVRSNHYHKTDWHFLHVLSGGVLYIERELPHLDAHYYVSAGQTFFTPPNVPHVVLFLLDSVLISMSRLARTHAEHESDVVRVRPLLTAQEIAIHLRS